MYLANLYTESGQTSKCSFSSVSTATIATKVPFFSIFRDLQDFHSFAPLRIQNFSQNLPHFLHTFTEISQKFAKFEPNFTKFQRNFAGISPKFQRIPQNSPKFPKIRRFPEPEAVPAEAARLQYASLSASNCAQPFTAALRDMRRQVPAEKVRRVRVPALRA